MRSGRAHAGCRCTPAAPRAGCAVHESFEARSQRECQTRTDTGVSSDGGSDTRVVCPTPMPAASDACGTRPQCHRGAVSHPPQRGRRALPHVVRALRPPAGRAPPSAASPPAARAGACDDAGRGGAVGRRRARGRGDGAAHRATRKTCTDPTRVHVSLSAPVACAQRPPDRHANGRRRPAFRTARGWGASWPGRSRARGRRGRPRLATQRPPATRLATA